MPAIAMKKEVQVEAKTLSIYCKVSDRFTAKLVDQMLGSYPSLNLHDPKTYISSVVSLFCCYPLWAGEKAVAKIQTTANHALNDLFKAFCEQRKLAPNVALRVILAESPISKRFDIGLQRIKRLGGDGEAKAVAAAPDARDGARHRGRYALSENKKDKRRKT